MCVPSVNGKTSLQILAIILDFSKIKMKDSGRTEHIVDDQTSENGLFVLVFQGLPAVEMALSFVPYTRGEDFKSLLRLAAWMLTACLGVSRDVGYATNGANTPPNPVRRR